MRAQGIQVDYGDLGQFVRPGRRGATIEMLAKGAEHFGMSTSIGPLIGVGVAESWQERGPFIVACRLSPAASHYVVVLAYLGGALLIMDPACGLQWVAETSLIARMEKEHVPVLIEDFKARYGSDEMASFLEDRLHGYDYSTEEARLATASIGTFAVESCIGYVDLLVRAGLLRKHGQAKAFLASLLEKGAECLPPVFKSEVSEDESTGIVQVYRPMVLELSRPMGCTAISRRKTRLIWAAVAGKCCVRFWLLQIFISVSGTMATLFASGYSALCFAATVSAIAINRNFALTGIIVAIAAAANSKWGATISSVAEVRIATRLREAVIAQWRDAPLPDIEALDASRELQRMDLVDVFAGVLARNVGNLLTAGVALALAAAVSVLAQPQLAMGLMLAICARAVIVRAFHARRYRTRQMLLVAMGEVQASSVEILCNVETIVLLSLRTISLQRFAAALDEAMKISRRQQLLQLATYCASGTAAMVVVAIALLAFADLDGGNTGGWFGVALACGAFDVSRRALAGMGPSLEGIGTTNMLTRRLGRYCDLSIASSGTIDVGDSEAGHGANWMCLSLEEVCISRDNRGRVLGPVNLKVHRGTSICIYGDTGSGKSTLLRALVGAVGLSNGEILLDGVNIRCREFAKARCFMLDHSDLIIPGSLRDNIVFGDEQIDVGDLAQACTVAGIASIEGIDHGLDTPLAGGAGRKLSTGQTRRVSLARALARTPALLLLDEALGAFELDVRAEIVSAMRKSYPSMAIIATSHDGLDAKLFDRSMRISAGRLTREFIGEEAN